MPFRADTNNLMYVKPGQGQFEWIIPDCATTIETIIDNADFLTGGTKRVNRRCFTLHTHSSGMCSFLIGDAAMTSILNAPFFHDESAAYEYVETHLWLNGPVCPHCGNAESSKIGRLTGKTTRIGLRKCYECR